MDSNQMIIINNTVYNLNDIKILLTKLIIKDRLLDACYGEIQPLIKAREITHGENDTKVCMNKNLLRKIRRIREDYDG